MMPSEVSRSNSLVYFWLLIGSFLTLGFLPIFWSYLKTIDSYTIFFHRCIWTFITLLPFVFYNKKYKTVIPYFLKCWKYFILSSALISINWLTYIYAVNNHHVFEASLAYFISPLITILFAFFFLKEKIRFNQWIAILLAGIAICYLLIVKGTFPKYALIIATSFSLYGLIGRKIPSSSMVRLIIESLFLSIACIIFLQSPFALFDDFLNLETKTRFFLIFSGLVTIVPLAIYIVSVRHIKFTTVGILSFIMPTVVFLIGIFYFEEKLDKDKLLSISLIWLGIFLYIYDLNNAARAKLLKPL